MKIINLLLAIIISLPILAESKSDDWTTLSDKTMVVWTAPADLKQSGGSAMTIDDQQSHFDGIVFGEIAPSKWMAGSDAFQRTQKEQGAYVSETAKPDSFVQMAVVYQGNNVSIYRNGEAYAAYKIKRQQDFDAGSIIMFGKRHLDMQGDGHYRGKIADARLYDKALTQDEIKALKPHLKSKLAPRAWWSFADGSIQDKTGLFTEIKLSGDVSVQDGALVLGGNDATMIASSSIAKENGWNEHQPVPASVIASARKLRHRLLADPYRPEYHFCVPEDDGNPGDPNGAFYYKGRYHLMYLYKNNQSGFCWGHVSSSDMLHWRHHPDAIGPGNGDEGCFSGGAFVDENGKATLSYWQLWGALGIGLAESVDENFDVWVKSPANPVIKSTEWGITVVQDKDGEELIYGSADPSNIWVKDGRYYMLTGNLLVLNKYGRKADSPPEMQGDRLYLFVSDDLKQWEYLHQFYKSDRKWTDHSEDNMCPSFLPLPTSPDGGAPSDKHLLLFISHNMGCQYYIGQYKNDKFYPANHGRMTWRDNGYFAPEALMDDDGRQIMWSWIFDDRPEEIQNTSGWSGTYGLPRSLWLGNDNTLRMRPIKELANLRLNQRTMKNILVKQGTEQTLDGLGGELMELEITIQPGQTKQCGVMVCCSEDGREQTKLYYDASDKKLKFDTTKSGIAFGRKIIEEGPLELQDGEPLVLRIFVDRSIVEVFANDRQAIARRIYPQLNGRGIKLFANGGDITVSSIKAWDIMPSNPY